MKIKSVETVLLSAPYGSPEDTELKRFYPLGKRSAAFVVVETDDGASGLGETYAGVFVPELVFKLIEMIGEKLIGLDPSNVAQLQAMMTRFVSYWGYTGFAKNVISAVEIALWDLKGKSLGVPVYELLGGARVDDIELYASGGLAKSPDDLADELREYVRRGFRAVKIRDRNLDVEPVETSRAALGADIKLIVDANQSFIPRPANYLEALRYARQISKYDVLFLEEPLAVEDFNGYRRLVQNSPMPISGGETLNSAALFRQYIHERGFDIVQPDASVVGGIGECWQVLTEARANSLGAVCHAYGAAVCQAANVHAAFASGCDLIEWATPPNPLREELLAEPWEIVDGRLKKPSAPGLGVLLTDDIRRKYRYIPGTANPGNFR
ncbi:MAG TPA: mandelate racemase/muconate lactonizing enzyme family protein [Pyrinomonadaceae bacterium]